MTRKGDPDPIESPDVEIGASFKAKSLKFRGKPKTKVDFAGEVREPGRSAEIETSSGSERHNLPEEVEPGVTYEDVRVRWSAAARIEDPAERDGEDGIEETARR